jgi:uncharacterized protein
MKAVHRNADVRQACTDSLQFLSKDCASLKLAVVVSDDGFDVASVLVEKTAGDRLASMTSSMQALGDAVMREVKMGDCDHLMIESATGHVIQRRVPGHPLVICAVFDQRETVGRCLYFTQECANQITARLIQTAA